MIIKTLNKLYLRYLKAKYSNLRISEGVKIDYQSSVNLFKGELVLGKNVRLLSRSKGYHAGMPFPCTVLIDVANAKVTIGDNSRLNGVYIHSQKEITIGRNCVFASGVNILDSNGHEIRSLDRTKGRDIPKEIVIGDNVWIGINSIILKGSRIGDNSVVAAGSVVKGDFPANSIISGNPAQIIDTIKFENENSNT